MPKEGISATLANPAGDISVWLMGPTGGMMLVLTPEEAREHHRQLGVLLNLNPLDPISVLVGVLRRYARRYR